MKKIMEAVCTAMILFVTGLLLWSFGRQDFRYQRYETDTIHYVKARTMEVLEQELTEGLRLNSVLYSGVIVSAMGAVMDVAVSMGASLGEIASLNPGLSGRELFQGLSGSAAVILTVPISAAVNAVGYGLLIKKETTERGGKMT